MTFLEYYKQQFKDIKEMWALARKKKKWLAFVTTFFCLFNPCIIYTMYLYDTGAMEIDKRFYKKGKKKNTRADYDIRFRRWMSNLKIHEHCHCDEKTLRAIWNAMDEEDK